MQDLEHAKHALTGHSIALVKGDLVLTHDGRGISPMMEYLANGTDLRGFSVADLIVGKAAAMLFVKAGIAAVYASTVSRAGALYLKQHGIPCDFGEMTERIINRMGTDICPMERAVLEIDDCECGYLRLRETLTALRSGSEG